MSPEQVAPPPTPANRPKAKPKQNPNTSATPTTARKMEQKAAWQRPDVKTTTAADAAEKQKLPPKAPFVGMAAAQFRTTAHKGLTRHERETGNVGAEGSHKIEKTAEKGAINASRKISKTRRTAQMQRKAGAHTTRKATARTASTRVAARASKRTAKRAARASAKAATRATVAKLTIAAKIKTLPLQVKTAKFQVAFWIVAIILIVLIIAITVSVQACSVGFIVVEATTRAEVEEILAMRARWQEWEDELIYTITNFEDIADEQPIVLALEATRTPWPPTTTERHESALIDTYSYEITWLLARYMEYRDEGYSQLAYIERYFRDALTHGRCGIHHDPYVLLSMVSAMMCHCVRLPFVVGETPFCECEQWVAQDTVGVLKTLFERSYKVTNPNDMFYSITRGAIPIITTIATTWVYDEEYDIWRVAAEVENYETVTTYHHIVRYRVYVHHRRLNHQTYLLPEAQLVRYANHLWYLGGHPELFCASESRKRRDFERGYQVYAIPRHYRAQHPLLDDIFITANMALGMPYVWGGWNEFTSFDCSGFVSWVLNQSGAMQVGSSPRYRTNVRGLDAMTTTISPGNQRVGDLIFWGTEHVGIYAGNGWFVHAGNPIGYEHISEYGGGQPSHFGRLPGF